MISKLQSQQQNQPSGQRPAGVQALPPPQQSTQSSMTPLNASNLQQLQQQEEAMRARQKQNQAAPAVPAAPQLSQPRPFSIGASSPQGIPQAYGPGGIPPEKLRIPSSKRRKQTHGPSTATSPVQAHAPVPSAKTETAKQPLADANRVVTGSFKCSVPECEYHQKGFTSQITLDKHNEESHKADEPIEDSVQFLAESFPPLVKEGEKAETKGIKKPAAVSVDMQRVPSKSTAGSSLKQDIKVEGITPPATKTTPMGQGVSQGGLKPVSPTMNQIPASRVSSSKGLGPSEGSQTLSKDGKKELGKQLDQIATPEAAVMKGPWAESLDTIRDTFGDFGDDRLPGLGCDPIEEFLNPDMFTKIQNKDTPDSMDSGIVTQTPKDGDSSQDEEIDVKIGGIPDDNWIPVDWYNLPSMLEGDLFVNENERRWDEMDWEKIEHKEADLSTDDGGMAIFA